MNMNQEEAMNKKNEEDKLFRNQCEWISNEKYEESRRCTEIKKWAKG